MIIKNEEMKDTIEDTIQVGIANAGAI